jgi:hypothetical protein
LIINNKEMPKELSGEDSDMDDDVEFPLFLIVLA